MKYARKINYFEKPAVSQTILCMEIPEQSHGDIYD
jgi:hypothetical protein